MPPRLASGRGLVGCPDWFQGTSLGSSLGLLPRLVPGTSLGSSLGWLPRLVPGTSLGSSLGLLPRLVPGTSLGSSLGWLPRLVPGTCSRTLQDAPGRSKRLFLGIGGLERSQAGRGRLGG
jgi:hypothetical protein